MVTPKLLRAPKLFNSNPSFGDTIATEDAAKWSRLADHAVASVTYQWQQSADGLTDWNVCQVDPTIETFAVGFINAANEAEIVLTNGSGYQSVGTIITQSSTAGYTGLAPSITRVDDTTIFSLTRTTTEATLFNVEVTTGISVFKTVVDPVLP